MPGDELPIHVLVEAFDSETLAKGVEIVKSVLIPVSKEEKKKQLRELAVINGFPSR